VSSIATDTANDVGSEVTLLGAVVLAMSDLATVLTSLVFVVTKGTVKSSQLSELISLELVLTFGDRGSRFNNVVHQLLRLVDLFLGICHDQTVKIFFLVASVSGVRATFSFLDGALATDSNFGPGLRLHLLQGVSTRTYE
jgi:hypothetical protein